MTLVRSVATLQDKIRDHIARRDLDAALILVQDAVDQIFCEPINTTRIFGSKLLDDFCQDIGAISWNDVLNKPNSRFSATKKASEHEPTVVYIASKLQASGGHTAALADIIRLAPPVRSIVLVSGISGATDRDAIQHRFHSIPNVTFEYAPRRNHVQKLEWLQQRLVELSPKEVWLFNHHQDSTAVAAVQPEAGYKLHFYHHGDHHLCLGVHLGYADHIDPHSMGFYGCRDQLGIKNNRYLPLVVKDLGDRPSSMEFLSGTNGLVTLTAGGFNKVEVPYFIQYVDLVPELLRTSQGKHIHIGRLSPMALKRIKKGLSRLGVPESAFLHIPFVPSVWKALHEHRVDLYIASFPYGGARTLIEAMGAGVPLAVHSHCSSRLLGTFDMAYEEALVWRFPNDLLDFVRNLNAIMLKEQGRLSRKRYEDLYQEEILQKALNDDCASVPSPLLHEGYMPDVLQQALDISNQVNIAGAIRRLFYRNFRKWRT